MLNLFKNLFGYGKKKKDELKITVMLIGLGRFGIEGWNWPDGR